MKLKLVLFAAALMMPVQSFAMSHSCNALKTITKKTSTVFPSGRRESVETVEEVVNAPFHGWTDGKEANLTSQDFISLYAVYKNGAYRFNKSAILGQDIFFLPGVSSVPINSFSARSGRLRVNIQVKSSEISYIGDTKVTIKRSVKYKASGVCASSS